MGEAAMSDTLQQTAVTTRIFSARPIMGTAIGPLSRARRRQKSCQDACAPRLH